MNIVVLTTSYPRAPGDPSGHFVATEVRMLAESGHEVTVLCPGPPATVGGPVEGLTVIQLGGADLFAWPGALARLRARPLRALHALRFVTALRRALKRLPRTEKVIAHWLVPCGYPAALASAGVLEIVAHGSDVRLVRALPRPLRHHILKALGARGASLRFVSEQLACIMGPDLQRVPSLQYRVAPSPVEVECPLTRAAARQALGVAPYDRLVVIMGRLVSGKRTDTALAALAILPRCRVVVVGDGPELRALAQRFPVARFTGRLPRPDALRWLRAADLLVTASRTEGSPTVVREARALGTPVVSCASGDLDAWARADTGLWVVD